METITSREMKALELNSEYFGVSRLQLMENSGKSIADEISSRFNPEKTKIAIFCGLGGNGGDGFASARHLVNRGFEVKVIIAGRSREVKDEAAKKNLEALKNLKSIKELRQTARSRKAVIKRHADRAKNKIRKKEEEKKSLLRPTAKR